MHIYLFFSKEAFSNLRFVDKKGEINLCNKTNQSICRAVGHCLKLIHLQKFVTHTPLRYQSSFTVRSVSLI